MYSEPVITCSHCDGFVPNGSRLCPNCDANVAAMTASAWRRAGQVAVAAASAMTLMACYGGGDDDFVPTNNLQQACGGSALLLEHNDKDTYGYGASNAIELSCSPRTELTERVYRYQANSAGVLTLTWTSDNAMVVGVRNECEDASELHCVNASTSGTLEVELDAQEAVVVILEAEVGAAYVLETAFTPQL